MIALSTVPADVGLEFDLRRWRALWLRLHRAPETWRTRALARAIRRRLTDKKQIEQFRAWALRGPLPLTNREIGYLVAQRARIVVVTDERTLRKYTADLADEAADARFDLDRQDAAFIERDVAEALLAEVLWSADGGGLLHRDHIRELSASTITFRHALEAGIWSEHDAHILSSILKRDVRGGPSIVIPYRRPGKRDPEFFRVKRTGGWGQRYLQPRRTPTGIFYPPGVLARGDLTDCERPLLVVEGEKKALALDRMGYAVVGLPGVWCAHDKAFRRATGLLCLHPWIRDDVNVSGRKVVVAFDSNIRWSRDVRRAAERTAEMFRAAGAADVRIVPWLSKPPVGLNGVDDLAAMLGDGAVHELINSAVPALPPFGIEVPASIAENADLTERQKLVYGALVARAVRGVARRVTLGDLAAVVGGSPQAVGHITRALHDSGWITRGRGKACRPHGTWVREPNSYILLGPTHGAFDVDPADVQIGDLAALVLGVLRRRTRQSGQQLADALGVTTSAVYRTVKALGPRVRAVNTHFEIM